MPETVDFDDIIETIHRTSAASVPPGADRAIRRSRQRRAAAATGGLVAAVATLAVGASVLLPATPEIAPPAGQDSQPALPEAAPFDADRLSAATDPWTSQWQPGDNGVSTDYPCLDGDAVRQLPKPAAEFDPVEVRLAQSSAGSFMGARFPNEAGAVKTWTVFEEAMSSCTKAEVTSNPARAPQSRSGQWSWKLGSDGDTGELWIVQHDNAVGIISLTGVAEAPPAVRTQVAEALLAALLDAEGTDEG